MCGAEVLSEAHLHHDISLEVILKALQLHLQHRREGVKEHAFPGILHSGTSKLSVKSP